MKKNVEERKIETLVYDCMLKLFSHASPYEREDITEIIKLYFKPEDAELLTAGFLKRYSEKYSDSEDDSGELTAAQKNEREHYSLLGYSTFGIPHDFTTDVFIKMWWKFAINFFADWYLELKFPNYLK
jgi:hypothetical protein